MDKPFPAYKGDDPYVFVCYAHADQAVYTEIRRLQDQGVNIWYDEGISAGKVWRAEIVKALEGASKFLYYISEASLESAHCNREVDYALDKELEIVPVFLDQTELTPELKLALNRVQALHRVNDENYEQHLLGALGQLSMAQHAAATKRKKFTWPLYVGLSAIAALVVIVIVVQNRGHSGPDDATVAVLPFAANDPQQSFFADGMADEIIGLLAKVDGLRVTARTSSFLYRERDVDVRDIGQTLGVALVLDGAVRRQGDRVRILAQLIDTETGFERWSQTFERQVDDVFAIQDEIARAVVVSVRGDDGLGIASAETFADVSAYEDYLRAVALLHEQTSASVAAAVPLLERVVAHSPREAQAHSLLAQAFLLASDQQYGDIPLTEAASRARPHIDRALELAPELSEAHAVDGLLMLFQGRFEAARVAFERAIELAPGNALAWHWLYFARNETGNVGGARAALVRAVALDPLFPPTVQHYGFALSDVRRGDVLQVMARFQERWPDHPFLALTDALLHLRSGELDQGHVPLMKFCETVGFEHGLCAINQIEIYYQLGLTEQLLEVGGSAIEPPLLDAFLCPVDALKPIDALAKFRSKRYEEAADAWSAVFAARPYGRDRLLGASYGSSVGRWEDVRGLLEPFAGSSREMRTYLVDLHPAHERFGIADLAMARKAIGDVEGAAALTAELVTLRADMQTYHEQHLVAERTLHVLDMSIAALEGRGEAALDAYRLAFEAGYRFRGPDQEPLLFPWRDLPQFAVMQAAYDAEITRMRENVLAQLAARRLIR